MRKRSPDGMVSGGAMHEWIPCIEGIRSRFESSGPRACTCTHLFADAREACYDGRNHSFKQISGSSILYNGQKRVVLAVKRLNSSRVGATQGYMRMTTPRILLVTSFSSSAFVPYVKVAQSHVLSVSCMLITTPLGPFGL